MRPRVNESSKHNVHPRVSNSKDPVPADCDMLSKSNAAKDYLIAKTLMLMSNLRYPARLKVAKAANAV